MLILRIRRAETALSDGRLDEAFALARAEDVRAHRRGQDLIGRLSRELVKRGRTQLEAGRLQQANADCEKASALAGNLPEITELRTALVEAGKAAEHAARERQQVLGAARREIRDGRLSMGEACLDGAPDESGANGLRNDVAAARGRIAALLVSARAAQDRSDWAAAVGALAEARRVHPSNQEVAGLVSAVCERLLPRVDEALSQGRLDLAGILLPYLESLRPEAVEVRESRRFLQDCRRAASAITGGDAREALAILKRLGQVRPAAAWLAGATRDALQAAEAKESLAAGPLGLTLSASGGGDTVHIHDTTVPVAPARREVPVAAPHPVGRQIPDRLLLHVDGAPSCLVLRNHRVLVGPAGSSARPDIPLMVASGSPTITIERIDEDYFVSCDRPISVNGLPVTRKLLAPGDRIEISPRCGLRFELPNPASPSAVLTLLGTRLPDCDARRVVLLDKAIVVSAGRNAHVRCDAAAEQAVLHIRDGRLFCRTTSEVTVEGRPMDRNAGIPLDARVQAGPLSLVVKSA